jgi:hypothetical protein
MKILFTLTAILASCVVVVDADQQKNQGNQYYYNQYQTYEPQGTATGTQVPTGTQAPTSPYGQKYYYNGNDAAQDDQVNNYNNYYAGDDAAGDDAAGDGQVDDYNVEEEEGTMYEGFTVCANTAIEVTDVQIYCDSPGTFYYGSGKYRNSQNCTAGDKGQFVVDFYINDAATIQSTGGEPVIDLSATGNIGWWQQLQKVYENEDLCSLDSLKSLSGAACPAEGKYRIQSHFYWEEDEDYAGVFYPSLTVGLKSSIYENTYDYGGANTPYCSGTTFFTSWKNSVKKIYANSVTNFFKTFGILGFTIAVMVAFIWFMVVKPVSIRDATTKIGFRKLNRSSKYDDDSSYTADEFDFDKMKSPRGSQSFLDF